MESSILYNIEQIVQMERSLKDLDRISQSCLSGVVEYNVPVL